MLSKRYESTEVDRRTWLHVPSGTPWSTSSENYSSYRVRTKVLTITEVTLTYNILTPKCIGIFLSLSCFSHHNEKGLNKRHEIPKEQSEQFIEKVLIHDEHCNHKTTLLLMLNCNASY